MTKSLATAKCSRRRKQQQHIYNKNQHIFNKMSAKYKTSKISAFRIQAQQQQKILHIGLLLIAICAQQVNCADLAISIPNNQGLDDAFYRLDYSPPYGFPEPNTTIPSNEIGDEIQFSRALPGTKYNFRLYYTNFTHQNWLTWTAAITTAPDPPSNLSVQVRTGKTAIISWAPPLQGNFTAFKIKVLGLSEASSNYNRTFLVTDTTFQHSAKELTPGATYQVQAYTIYDGKESVAYTSRNFTTSKSTRPPGSVRPSKCYF